jgi:KaiC/GvpD/RAD55 family RecA-like ATPase
LADCAFIDKKENVLITGSTGIGKSYIASAIGHQACSLGYKVMYEHTAKLFARLKNQIHKDKDSREKIFVARANHSELSKTHKDWLEWNDKRENNWINVIHDYFPEVLVSFT